MIKLLKSEITKELVLAAKPRLLSFAIFHIGCDALAFFLYAPVVAFVLDRIIYQAGDLAITNFDLLRFIGSPIGLVFVILSIMSVVVRFLFEVSGLVYIAASKADAPLSQTADAVRFALLTFPRLTVMAAAATIGVMICVAPIMVVAFLVYSGLLSDADINWYLSQRPPAFWMAAFLIGLLALAVTTVLVILTARWSMAIPILVFENIAGRRVLNRSWTLTKGHQGHLILLLVGWLAIIAVVSGATFFALDYIAGWALGLFSSVRMLTVIAGAFLIALAIASVAVSFAFIVGIALLLARGYRKLTGGWLPAAPADEVGQPAWSKRGAVAIAFVLLILAAGTSWKIIDAIELDSSVKITAHRGSSKSAPENTLSAIRQAITDGADYAEIDVQLLADGSVILFHDSDLKRIAGDDRRIAGLTYKDLEGIDVGSWFSPKFAREPIPTLQQAIGLAADKIRLNIELKFRGNDEDLVDRVVGIIRRLGFEKRCVITSLDLRGLKRVKSIAPELKTGLIISAVAGDYGALGVDFFSFNSQLADTSRVRAERKAGRQVHVWTVNDIQKMLAMIERGVSNIITDRPALLHKVIHERKQLSEPELLLLALARRIRHSRMFEISK